MAKFKTPKFFKNIYVQIAALVCVAIIVIPWLKLQYKKFKDKLDQQSVLAGLDGSVKEANSNPLEGQMNVSKLTSCVTYVMAELDKWEINRSQEGIVNTINDVCNNQKDVLFICDMFTEKKHKSLKAELQSGLLSEWNVFSGGRYSKLNPVVRDNLK